MARVLVRKIKGMERATASEKSERAGVAQARPGSDRPLLFSLSLRTYAMASTPDRASDMVDLLTDLG